MSAKTKRPNTIKYMGKKIANNGDENDYSKTPIGADSDNVDRPDNSTVEESLVKIETEKVEIIPVEALPESNIKVYPYIYALVKPSESKGILYEYKNDRWINYSNGAKGIWVGTKEECVKDFNNIESGTIVIIIKKKSDSGETHTHDYVCQITKEPTYSQSGIKTYTCFLCGDTYTEEIPALIDSINPAGVIRIGDNEYATWKDTISFDSYYKDDQTVTIEATDNETGVKEISYYLSNTAINDSSIGTVTWTSYTDPFTIQPNDNYIVYARITDNADNVTYICSDGIVMDNIPPVFEGLEDGGIYPAGTVLTVEEGATLSVNDEVVELVNNSYTFTEPMDNIRLSLTDRAGNSSSISIDIIHVHNYTQEITKEATCTEDGIITYTCECGDTYTETIPTSGHHDFVDGICTVCGKSEYEDFELTESNYYKTGLTSLSGDIIVPATFEFNGQKYKTTKISLTEVNDLVSLSLPDTVSEIKYIRSASLKEISMTDNVTKINGIRCSNLQHIVLSSGIKEIPLRCFSECSSILTIDGIGSGASIEIPNSVKIINELAFENATNLISVNIPEGVEEIGEVIFNKCPNLKKITIPNSYNKLISNHASSFGDSKSVTEFYYNSDHADTFGSELRYLCSESGCDVYIGENVNKISNIWQFVKFTSFTIQSQNIEEIPSLLFYGQKLLTNFIIPDSIIKIGRSAFHNCTNISNLIIPSSVESIDPDAFYNVPHITYHGSATGSPWGALAIN